MYFHVAVTCDEHSTVARATFNITETVDRTLNTTVEFTCYENYTVAGASRQAGNLTCHEDTANLTFGIWTTTDSCGMFSCEKPGTQGEI